MGSIVVKASILLYFCLDPLAKCTICWGHHDGGDGEEDCSSRATMPLGEGTGGRVMNVE